MESSCAASMAVKSSSENVIGGILGLLWRDLAWADWMGWRCFFLVELEHPPRLLSWPLHPEGWVIPGLLWYWWLPVLDVWSDCFAWDSHFAARFVLSGFHFVFLWLNVGCCLVASLLLDLIDRYSPSGLEVDVDLFGETGETDVSRRPFWIFFGNDLPGWVLWLCPSSPDIPQLYDRSYDWYWQCLDVSHFAGSATAWESGWVLPVVLCPKSFLLGRWKGCNCENEGHSSL